MRQKSEWIRSGVSRTIVVVALVLTLAVSAGGWSLWTRYRQNMYQDRIAAARLHLQLAENDQALELLSLRDDGDAPAEYHYLRALTLERLGRGEPALAEIRRAMAEQSRNPRYKAYELKLRLLARDKIAVDQLIELNRDFASVAAVALFATYGLQAKEMLLDADRKPQAAEFHRKRRNETLDTALTLAAEIPELHPELLNFAVRNGRHDAALKLINDLLLRDPDSIGLRAQKINVLMQLKRTDDAIEITRKLYQESREGRDEAEYYATVLSQGSGSDDHDRQFEELVRKFPLSIPVLSKQAMYLTRTGRLSEAEAKLNAAIARQTLNENRESLAFMAITLPLEVGVAEIADEQYRNCEKYLRDPLLREYFEARILYLRRDYGPAIRQMLKIAKAAENRDVDSKLLATEALKWVRTMLADKVIVEQLATAMKSAAQEATDAPLVRVEDASSQTPPDKKPAQDGAAPDAPSPGKTAPPATTNATGSPAEKGATTPADAKPATAGPVAPEISPVKKPAARVAPEVPPVPEKADRAQ